MTNLSMWAALKTTSNSVLSNSAAFFAISAASIKRDSSSRNWPERQNWYELEMQSMQNTWREKTHVKQSQKEAVIEKKTLPKIHYAIFLGVSILIN